jgi:hypothetical protein
MCSVSCVFNPTEILGGLVYQTEILGGLVYQTEILGRSV